MIPCQLHACAPIRAGRPPPVRPWRWHSAAALPAAGPIFYPFPGDPQDSITRSRMVGDPPDVLITPHMASIGMMDFVRAEESIAIGYSAVERLLPEIEHHLKRPG